MFSGRRSSSGSRTATRAGALSLLPCGGLALAPGLPPAPHSAAQLPPGIFACVHLRKIEGRGSCFILFYFCSVVFIARLIQNNVDSLIYIQYHVYISLYRKCGEASPGGSYIYFGYFSVRVCVCDQEPMACHRIISQVRFKFGTMSYVSSMASSFFCITSQQQYEW